jgi:hypothetical protein
MLAQGRKNMVRLISAYNEDQLNKIPEGYNNNLIWNFAHAVVSQQVLCYELTGLEPVIPEGHIAQFRRGTRPEHPLRHRQIDELKEFAFSTADSLKQDYQKGLFQNFENYQSLYGVELNSIEDAIVFNNMHEGLHLGYMMAMRKLINNR